MRQGRERQALFWRALAMAVHKVTQLFSLSTVTGMKLAGSGREAWAKKKHFVQDRDKKSRAMEGSWNMSLKKDTLFATIWARYVGVKKIFRCAPGP